MARKTKKKKPRRQGSSRSGQNKRQEVSLEELKSIIEKAKDALSKEDHQKLGAAIDTLAFITQELEAKGASIRRLRALLFGAKTEKTKQVLKGLLGGKSGEEGETEPEEASTGSSEPADEIAAAQSDSGGKKANNSDAANRGEKKKGHGRNGSDAYTGAEKVTVSHHTLCHKDPCP